MHIEQKVFSKTQNCVRADLVSYGFFFFLKMKIHRKGERIEDVEDFRRNTIMQLYTI